jgi:hypothetical protein
MVTKKKNAPKASENRADDPCWNGYEKIGMKTKNGKKVPNCVPEKESATASPATPFYIHLILTIWQISKYQRQPKKEKLGKPKE